MIHPRSGRGIPNAVHNVQVMKKNVFLCGGEKKKILQIMIVD